MFSVTSSYAMNSIKNQFKKKIKKYFLNLNISYFPCGLIKKRVWLKCLKVSDAPLASHWMSMILSLYERKIFRSHFPWTSSSSLYVLIQCNSASLLISVNFLSSAHYVRLRLFSEAPDQSLPWTHLDNTVLSII